MRASVASLSKKFISTFFAATLALGLVPASAFAVEDSGADAPKSEESAYADPLDMSKDESWAYEDRSTTNDTDAVIPSDSLVIPSDSEESALIERNEGEALTTSWEEAEATVIPAGQFINQTMPLETVAQQESTRSFFLAQTLESTRTIPMVSANLPLDTGDSIVEPDAEGEGLENEGSDDSDESDLAANVVAAESTVVGAFEYRGITYAVEPGGESVAVVAADYSKLPDELVEAQVIVVPSVTTNDGVDYYSVTRIADYAFVSFAKESVESDASAQVEEPDDGIIAVGIPASVVSIDAAAFTGFRTLQYIVVSDDNPIYSSYDGVLYSADQTSLLLVPEGRLGAVRIAPSVTEVNSEAFSHCPSVDTLVADADSAAFQLLQGSEMHSMFACRPSTDREMNATLLLIEERIAAYSESAASESSPLLERGSRSVSGENAVDVLYGNGGMIFTTFGGVYYYKVGHTGTGIWSVNGNVVRYTRTVDGVTKNIDTLTLQDRGPNAQFIGWSKGSANPNSAVTRQDFIKNSTDLYANWKVKLLWDPQGGSWDVDDESAQEVRVSTEWKLVDHTAANALSEYTATSYDDSTLPSRKGYTFKGWNSDASARTGVMRVTVPNPVTPKGEVYDVCEYAIWENHRYTIDLDANAVGATVSPASIPAVYDEESTLPTPALSGYTFKGWDTVQAGTGVRYEAGEPTSLNLTDTDGARVTLYAQWEPTEYAITFSPDMEGLESKTLDQPFNGDMPNLADTDVFHGESYDGFTFMGYFDERGTQYYSAEGTPLVSQWDKAAPATLTARWSYTLVLSANTDPYGATDTVSLKPASETGASAEFVADDTGAFFTATVVKGESVTLYNVSRHNTPAKVAALASRTRDGEPAGYAFQGFFVGPDKQDKRTSGDFANLCVDGVAMLYFGWSAEGTKLAYDDSWTYEKDGRNATVRPAAADAGDHTANEQAVFDEPLQNLRTTPYIPGWKFEGYYVKHGSGAEPTKYIEADGSAAGAWAETTATDAVADAEGNIVLFAFYTPRTYRFTASFDCEGASGDKPDFSLAYGDALPSGPYAAARPGYDFGGWYFCANASQIGHVFGECGECVKLYDGNGRNNMGGVDRTVWNIDSKSDASREFVDVLLHAVWKPGVYTITWSENWSGGSNAFATTQGQVYGATIERPASNPTRPGYTFMGWYTKAADGQGFKVMNDTKLGDTGFEAKGSERALTYYAHWSEPQDYSITLIAGTGGYFETADGGRVSQWSYLDRGATKVDYDIRPSSATNAPKAWTVWEDMSAYHAYAFRYWEEVVPEDTTDFTPIDADALARNIIPANTAGHHTLRAVWKVNEFTTTFYAYDPDLPDSADEKAKDFNERVKSDANILGNGADSISADTPLVWRYGAAASDDPEVTWDIPWNTQTAFPTVMLEGYEFKGWRLREVPTSEPSLSLVANPRKPISAEYVACFEPLVYTVHFYVGENEQLDASVRLRYGESLTLPGIASRTSLSSAVVADEETNTVTSRNGHAFYGWWDVSLHADDPNIVQHEGWKPGVELPLETLLSTDGIHIYAADHEATSDPAKHTHVSLFAQHSEAHALSVTVPLRANILVAVDDPAAPIKVFSGAISTESNGGPYRVEAIICDPLDGTQGAAATFTDNGGVKRAAETCLTLRKESGASMVRIPLDKTTVVPREELEDCIFSVSTTTQDNSLHLEYGLEFPEGMTAVDFKNSLPEAEGASHSIARLYYTIGFAPQAS